MRRDVTAKIRRSFSLWESLGAVTRTKKPRDGGKKGKGKRKQVGGGRLVGRRPKDHQITNSRRLIETVGVSQFRNSGVVCTHENSKNDLFVAHCIVCARFVCVCNATIL